MMADFINAYLRHLASVGYILYTIQCRYQGLLYTPDMIEECGLVMPYGGTDLGQHWLR